MPETNEQRAMRVYLTLATMMDGYESDYDYRDVVKVLENEFTQCTTESSNAKETSDVEEE